VPTVADRVSARSGGFGQEWREALHPPEHGHMIDLDPTLTQEFLDVAIRQPETQIPTDRQDDHLGRKPEALERRTLDYGNLTSMRSHPVTVALERGPRPRNTALPAEPVPESRESRRRRSFRLEAAAQHHCAGHDRPRVRDHRVVVDITATRSIPRDIRLTRSAS
jgi:hypothetical protein